MGGVNVTYVKQPTAASANGQDESNVFNPAMLQAARLIYSNYCETHAQPKQPLGIAIDQETHRGHLIFTGKPILLPQECFVTLQQIEAPEPEPELVAQSLWD